MQKQNLPEGTPICKKPRLLEPGANPSDGAPAGTATAGVDSNAGAGAAVAGTPTTGKPSALVKQGKSLSDASNSAAAKANVGGSSSAVPTSLAAAKAAAGATAAAGRTVGKGSAGPTSGKAAVSAAMAAAAGADAASGPGNSGCSGPTVKTEDEQSDGETEAKPRGKKGKGKKGKRKVRRGLSPSAELRYRSSLARCSYCLLLPD